MSEIILIDKPAGITSFDVIRELRKKLQVRKMGHAGTLDPLATGLLIIGIGDGTKKLDTYLKLPKVYRAGILLGERRTTGDMGGEILETSAVGEITNSAVAKVLASLIGEVTWYFRNDVSNSNLHWIKLNIEKEVEKADAPRSVIVAMQYYYYW